MSKFNQLKAPEEKTKCTPKNLIVKSRTEIRAPAAETTNKAPNKAKEADNLQPEAT